MKRKIGATYFNDELVYDGNDLGAVYTKEKTTFRIWTPAAGKVSLNLYEQGDGDNLIETIPMTADVKGTWVCRILWLTLVLSTRLLTVYFVCVLH